MDNKKRPLPSLYVDGMPPLKKNRAAFTLAHPQEQTDDALAEEQHAACFDCLPPELKWHILKYIGEEDNWAVMICRHVCRQWKAMLPVRLSLYEQETNTLCNLLAEAGQLSCLEWAARSGYAFHSQSVFYNGSMGCHLEIMQWAHKKMASIQFVLHYGGSRYAAANNRRDIFEWLKSAGIRWEEHEAMKSAALHGHAQLMDYLLDEGASWRPTYCELAARKGAISVLELADRRGLWWDKVWCFLTAATKDHLHLIEWAFSLPNIYDVGGRSSLCVLAARAGLTGQLEILTKEYGCHLGVGVFDEAARGGHIETMAWLKENGCPWDKTVCVHASKGNHLAALRWLREHGCPWDKLTCVYAAEEGHLEILRWAYENGCPWNKTQCLSAAIQFDQLHVIIWIQSLP